MSGQAIRTRFYGPTNFRGSCTRAKCEAGTVRVPYEYAWDAEANHLNAMHTLATKLGWGLDGWEYGVFNNDYYWVRS